MQIRNKAFLAIIKGLYVQNPCQVSSIAFWKVAQLCQEAETYCHSEKGSRCLYAFRNQRLEFYWSDDRQHFPISSIEIEWFDFLVLHTDFYELITDQISGYEVKASCPLLYDLGSSQGVEYDNKFFITGFNFAEQREFIEAAEVLNQCYETDNYQAKEVATWCQLPVFDNSLWLWVRSRTNNEVVGLGISTYQKSIRETYLDWIQIMPEYRGRGAGRLLVAETIKRAREKSDIIRVTGIADDFYRKCGFVGTERWYTISKKK